jgi:hypothetical protein
MRTLYRLVYRSLLIGHCYNSSVTGVRLRFSNGNRYQTFWELQANGTRALCHLPFEPSATGGAS